MTEKQLLDAYMRLGHDLRTPLNIMLSTLQLMERADFSKDCPERHLKYLKHSAYSMLRIVNSMLDSRRLALSGLQNAPVACDLSSLEVLVAGMQPYFDVRAVTLNAELPAATPCSIDEEKLERVLVNLLANALKYTAPGGSVLLSGWHEEGTLHISIKDTGCGMTRDEVSRLFGEYQQRDPEPGSTGMGLALVRDLIALMDGDIRVISNPGCGTEFVLTLPCPAVSEALPERQNAQYGYWIPIEMSDESAC